VAIAALRVACLAVRLAVQLYTLREQLEEDLEATLAALAATGVREVELAGFHGRRVAAFRAALDAAGLDAVSAHVPLERFETDLEHVLEEARVLTVEALVVPWVPEPADADAADALVTRLVQTAGRVLDAGFAFAYHNHAFEFGAHGLWDRIVAAGLDLEPDVGWLHVAGRDPVTTLAALHGRCPLVHAKDMRDGRDVVIGEGELDWPAITDAATDAGAARFVVELDNPSADPVDDLSRSLAALRAA
jgi:sugar phosphate isomerase/epimerase